MSAATPTKKILFNKSGYKNIKKKFLFFSFFFSACKKKERKLFLTKINSNKNELKKKELHICLGCDIYFSEKIMHTLNSQKVIS